MFRHTPKLGVANRLIEGGFYPPRSFPELPRHDFVVRARCDEVQGMNATSLSNPVDASDALFQSERRPRNFEVDDKTAAVVEVKAFARGIGCKQQRSVSVIEPPDDVRAFTE